MKKSDTSFWLGFLTGFVIVMFIMSITINYFKDQKRKDIDFNTNQLIERVDNIEQSLNKTDDDGLHSAMWLATIAAIGLKFA